MALSRYQNTTDDLKPGLAVLHDVHAFSIGLDGSYRIKKSPNLPLPARMGPQLDDEYERVEPSMTVFVKPSHLDQETVDSILCEYAQKLQILLASTDQTTGGSSIEQSPVAGLIRPSSGRARMSDHKDILNQVRSLDPVFAEEVEQEIIKYIDVGLLDVALRQAETMCGKLKNAFDYKESFAIWLKTELARRSDERCDPASLNKMLRDIDHITIIRRWKMGVSIGKQQELRAKVVFRMMSCFHQGRQGAR